MRMIFTASNDDDDDYDEGPSVSVQFVFLTYILGVAWLGVFGFSAVPVFVFYNMWSTCAALRSPVANVTSEDSICIDVRQYGERAGMPFRGGSCR